MIELKSPIVAQVARIEAGPGTPVAAKQPVVILVSMKMEFEVKSPQAGVVRSVRVREGDTVQKGDVLAVIAEGALMGRPLCGA